MNPGLSRLVARRVQRLDGVSMADRAVIADVVARAATVAELPEWLRSRLGV